MLSVPEEGLEEQANELFRDIMNKPRMKAAHAANNATPMEALKWKTRSTT